MRKYERDRQAFSSSNLVRTLLEGSLVKHSGSDILPPKNNLTRDLFFFPLSSSYYFFP